MAAQDHRKIDLQSPKDFFYLVGNTIAVSRQKLDLSLPPSATNDDAPDPMRERVQELVDDYINRIFTTASSSISINGIESSHPEFPTLSSFTTTETVEYEPFDSELASRVSALYAQLESLNTTVAQLRREAPKQAAEAYATQLNQLLKEEEEAEKDMETETDTKEDGAMDVDGEKSEPKGSQNGVRRSGRRNVPDQCELQIPLGPMAERWQSGDMAEVYEATLRKLQRLQGEANVHEEGPEGNALATTVGKAERAGRAADVVESMR